MINGVNNNNINSYRNHSVRPSKTDMDAPPFLLQYEEKGVVWDRKAQEEKEKTKEAEDRLQKAAAADGKPAPVKTPDVRGLPSAKEASKAEGQAGESLLQGIFNGIKGFLTGIFHFIWYGEDGKEGQTHGTQGGAPAQGGVASASGQVKTAAAAGEEDGKTDQDALIRELIAKHDTKGVVDILTKNHTIQPARNSTLLTYYNRHGKIVELNRTNTGRILHGDRHTRDL